MKPAAGQWREQLHRIGRLQIEQRVGQSADIAKREQPRGMHGEPALEAGPSPDLPAIEQHQQAPQNQRENCHAADQAVGDPAVGGERLPRRPLEEDVDVGRVGAEDQRREALAASFCLSPAWPSAQPVRYG